MGHSHSKHPPHSNSNEALPESPFLQLFECRLEAWKKREESKAALTDTGLEGRTRVLTRLKRLSFATISTAREVRDTLSSVQNQGHVLAEQLWTRFDTNADGRLDGVELKALLSSAISESQLVLPLVFETVLERRTQVVASRGQLEAPETSAAEAQLVVDEIKSRLLRLQRYVHVATSVLQPLLDANGDGVVTKEEFLSNYDKALEVIFNPAEMVSHRWQDVMFAKSLWSEQWWACSECGLPLDKETSLPALEDPEASPVAISTNCSFCDRITNFKFTSLQEIESTELKERLRKLETESEHLRTTAAEAKTKISAAEARNDELESSTLCVVCLDQPRELLFQPCSHFCCCRTCGELEALAECPMCRAAVQTKTRVFA